jgi:hypothetical protein
VSLARICDRTAAPGPQPISSNRKPSRSGSASTIARKRADTSFAIEIPSRLRVAAQCLPCACRLARGQFSRSCFRGAASASCGPRGLRQRPERCALHRAEHRIGSQTWVHFWSDALAASPRETGTKS